MLKGISSTISIGIAENSCLCRAHIDAWRNAVIGNRMGMALEDALGSWSF